MFQTNVPLMPAKKMSSWRKIALGTWSGPGDPSVYGSTDLPIENVLNYIEKESQRTGERITITHFMGKVFAYLLKNHPELNSMIRMGRIYPRKEVSVFYQVANDQLGEDLSGALIRNTDQKPLHEIARELNSSVKQVRNGEEKIYSRGKKVMHFIPGIFSRLFLSVIEFISYTLNIWSPLLGVPKDGFGSLMITNIGSLGLDMAYAPLVPYSRVPVLVVLGAVKDQPIVENGEIKIKKFLKVCITFDHRVIDGVHGARMFQTLLKIMDHPEKYIN